VRLFRQDTKVEALGKAPLFEELSKKELTELARVTDDLEVAAGTVLCREGQSGSEFFVIMDGDVEVTKNGRRVKTGSGAGEFFGEIALIADIPRTATVTAKTPVRLFVLTARAFWSMLDDFPSIERKVLRTLAKRLVDISADPTLA
jgi:CRP-like cAMP-binding protein